MHQFNVFKIGPGNKIAECRPYPFINASLFIIISGAFMSIILFLGTREKN